MKAILAAALLTAVSFTTLAFAADPKDPVAEKTEIAAVSNTAADARAVASDADVGQARRAYRAQCNRFESADFCECVTAGVAQALSPADLHMALRGMRERLTAQGDTPSAAADAAIDEGSPMSRIEQTEAHYADSCATFRR